MKEPQELTNRIYALSDEQIRTLFFQLRGFISTRPESIQVEFIHAFEVLLPDIEKQG